MKSSPDPSPDIAHTTTSGGALPSEEPFRVVRRRNRVPLSCYACRSRKKCDRNHPCTNCVKRDGAGTTSCSYAPLPARKKAQASPQGPDDMQTRIDRLEGLVLSLIHGGASVSGPGVSGESSVSDGSSASQPSSTPASGPNPGSSAAPVQDGSGSVQDSSPAAAGSSAELTPEDLDDDSETDDSLAHSLGILKVDSDRGKSMYFGQQHWHSVLADITEVKNYFIKHRKELEHSYEKVLSSKTSSSRTGLTLLFGATPASDVELRAEVPPKSTVLGLCARFFSSIDGAVTIIHSLSFYQQLEAHWEDPSKTPIMWLGLLYSILCLAMLSYHRVGDEPPQWRGRALDLSTEYKLRTVQCLVAADYTNPTEYTVETMVLYLFGELSSRWDTEVGLWLVSSLITRTAFRQGYHRDGKWFSSISPFQSEMRRRTWAIVRMCDVLFSQTVSLPTMISGRDCDTQLPSNILDEDFGPSSTVLPPPKPLTEPTPTAYMISKAQLCIELGNVLQTTTRVGKPVPYDDILQLDSRLRTLRSELPPHLEIRALEGCRDPLMLIIARFNIDTLYQKIICLLHRNYLSRAHTNPRYAHSRRTAVEAALQTLNHLCVLHRESQPTGVISSLRWHVDSIATKDFLLPAMLIAVDLHWDSRARISSTNGLARPGPSAFLWTEAQRAEMISRLETTRDIWKGLSDVSIDAFKASNILEVMLQQIKDPTVPTASHGPGTSNIPMCDYTPSDSQSPQGMPSASYLIPQNQTSAPLATGFVTQSHDGAGQFGGAAQGDIWGVNSFLAPTGIGLVDNSMGGLGGFSSAPAAPLSVLDTSMDLAENFDWNAVASYAQNANWGSDQNFEFFSGTGGQNYGGDGSGDPFQPSGSGRQQ